jgi:protein TonB
MHSYLKQFIPSQRTRFRPMVVLSATAHVVFAVVLVWGPSWIKPRPIAAAYEVQLVSLPVERSKPKPEPARPEPRPAPVQAKPKPQSVKKPAPPPVEKSTPKPKPGPAAVPEPEDEPAPPEPAESSPDQAVAKVTEPTEAGIQIVAPLMEAVALKYPYYFNALTRKIDENWAPPGAAFAEANEVLVVFTILRDGNVRDVEIAQSSGDAFYDQAALRALRRATPFPALPPGYAEDTMTIYLGFTLKPDRKS